MKLRVAAVAMCASLLLVPAAFAGTTASMNIAGDVETNTTVEFKDDGSNNYNSWANEGRTKIEFTGRVEGDNGWFATAVADAMIDSTGSTGVDDSYVEFGNGSFSFLVGRWEATSLFGKGQDTLIVSAPGAPERYEGNYIRGRLPINNMALKVGGLEIGIIVGGLDEGTIYGVSTDSSTGVTTPGVIEIDTALNAYGARPLYTYSIDMMTLTFGGEFVTRIPQNSDESDAELNHFGGAATAEFNVGGTLGLSLAYGAITGQDDSGEDLLDTNTLSSMIYYTMPVGEGHSLGLMGGYTMQEVDTYTEDSAFEGYISFKQQLPVEGLFLTYAGSYAGASFDRDDGADPDDTSNFGMRVRVNYDF